MIISKYYIFLRVETYIRHINVCVYLYSERSSEHVFVRMYTYFAFFGSMPVVGPEYVGVRQSGGLFAFCGTKGCLACAGDVCEP